ncbi:MAG: 1-(5-phosphoribosyl)-5-[(5-phosphoribosylamino)methylideneamino]imidazole-4-carboxamide isomerase [Candidatus Bathyarchaeia archaeon]
MLVIPSVDIKDGRCVKLIKGKPGSGRVISQDPIEVAKRWEEEGAELLHLIDLDAAITGSKGNRKIVENILREVKVPVEVGGGVRTVETASSLIKAGAEWVIMGTAAVENPDIAAETARVIGPSRLIIAIDSEEAGVLVRGWTQQTYLSTLRALEYFQDLKVAAFLYTDVKVEGTLSGVDLKSVERLASYTDRPIIYSGGITSLREVGALAKLGLKGAVIGRALYDGYFTLKEAMDVAKSTSGYS